jgi:prepilin-type N-terminal cleavage/methylation domain-containing protein
MSSRPAFTLMELVLVIALIVIILAFTAPIAWSFVAQNDLDVSAGIAVQELRRAQALAAVNIGGGGWGVELQSQEIILFQGASFNSRNPAFDEEFDLPAGLDIVGASEVDFLPESGWPTAPAIITLTDSLNQSAGIEVNGVGAVSY